MTPTVGTPVFTLGATSTRCQGAGTVTYTATATNSQVLLIALNVASSCGGNTINSTTGAVTYAAGFMVLQSLLQVLQVVAVQELQHILLQLLQLLAYPYLH